MLRAISFKIYEMRRYLVLSLVISLVAIPFGNMIVIQRDRNRNEMYGEAFWIYGFGVYNMTDQELAESLPPEWGFNDGLHVLPSYLGNVKYEYPVFGLIFFAIATWLFPGVNDLQPLWLNFLLVLTFNLNLVLIAILLGDKIYYSRWARLFFAGYFVYGLIMSAGGGKLEPIADCLLLMTLVLRQEKQYGKAMFTLGLAVQTKIYPAIFFPLIFIEAPLAAAWFFVSMLLTVVPLTVLGVNFQSLVNHFLNTSEYSSYIVNPLYPGLGIASPNLTGGGVDSYFWPPGFVPLVVYVFTMLLTIQLYLPKRNEFAKASWKKRIELLRPLYLYLLPGVLFLFRWVMPWYLFWLGPAVLLYDNDEQAIGYLKIITVVGLLYCLGIACNWPYFITGPLPDFTSHFVPGWYSLVGLTAIVLFTAIAYALWKKAVERRDRQLQTIREAEERGELII